jgi:hypothetical protein
MAENTGFVDPLDNIIRKTKEAYGIPDDVSTPTVNKTPPAVDIDIEDEEDDDIYGVHDFEKEIEEEGRQLEAAEEARKQAILAERRANEKPVEKMPPRSLDPNFQKEAVDFQAEHVAIVTGMIEKVKAKYHLVGGIPQEKQRFIQGDLLE